MRSKGHLERSDSSIPPTTITKAGVKDGWSEVIPGYQLGYSKRPSSAPASLAPFSLSLRSSHIPPTTITNNALLFASLRFAPRPALRFAHAVR